MDLIWRSPAASIICCFGRFISITLNRDRFVDRFKEVRHEYRSITHFKSSLKRSMTSGWSPGISDCELRNPKSKGQGKISRQGADGSKQTGGGRWRKQRSCPCGGN
jgi:hypothetical protein